MIDALGILCPTSEQMMKTLQNWLLVASFLLAFSSSSYAGKADDRLDVYWVDVEGGAATLIVTPAGESILIDSGNPGGRDSGRIAKVAKETAGLNRIDYLITTHFHIDHFGGAYELSQLIPIGTVIDKGIPDFLPEDRSFPIRIKPYREINAKRMTIRSGDRIELMQSPSGAPVSITCMAADRQINVRSRTGSFAINPLMAKMIPNAIDTSDNANSVNVLVEYGDFRFYDGGDTTWNVEAQLVTPYNNIGTVDVYQVNHHGLDTSNNPVLVHSLDPTVTVMNNGTLKGCGPKSFASVSSSPSIQAMYQVHKNLRDDGDHVNTSDGLIANHRADCDGHFIKLSVAPDGTTYSMAIPATDHVREFKTRVR